MKLFESFSARGYHTSLVTTFCIDFETYENVALPRLRGSGCTNNLVVMDQRMLSLALDQAMPPPRLAGRSYTVSGVTPGTGVYHPKIVLQIGKTQGRLIIGSANMTASGLAGNLEVTGEIVCDHSDSVERSIIVKAWRFALRNVDRNQGTIDRQVRWALDRSPWLRAALADPDSNAEVDGAPRFMGTGEANGIAARYAAVLQSRLITRLIVVSPYWDEQLEALKYLLDQLKPDEVVALIQKEHHLFPGPAASKIRGLRVINVGSGQNLGPSEARFLHAKLLIAQSADADHVLYGSANCTVAALGNGQFPGVNQEVCICQRLPPGSAVESLGLASILQAVEITVDELKVTPVEYADEIAMGEAQRRNPGRFELDQSKLTWWPPEELHIESSHIQLLNEKGDRLTIGLTIVHQEGRVIQFRLAGNGQRPSFALVATSKGVESGISIITCADELRHAVRDIRSSAVERAVADLEGDFQEGLWLLEVIETIDLADRSQAVHSKVGVRGGHGGASLDTDLPDFKQLSYDQFIAGRRADGDRFKVSRNALVSSDLSLVRNFLNRILRVEECPPGSATDGAADAAPLGAAGSDPTDLDSTDNDLPDSLRQPLKVDPNSKQMTTAAQRVLRQASATRLEIAEAVRKFIKQTSKLAADDGLSASHALRLRALLMILAAAATSLPERSLIGKRTGLTSLQVLPIDGEDGWPTLMGILLYWTVPSSPVALMPPCAQYQVADHGGGICA